MSNYREAIEAVNSLRMKVAVHVAEQKFGPEYKVTPFWTNEMGLTQVLYVDVVSDNEARRINSNKLLPNDWDSLMDIVVSAL